ncbi:MAG: Na+/H+ antiporter NhaC family protein [Planctomycetota bacterium]|nr:Na+/H+ antiporter NhaC family protein [Planctomycetota bacterium]
MTRFAPLAILVLLFGALFLMNGADPAEVAALRAGELLSAPVTETFRTTDLDDAEEPPTLLQAILDSAAVTVVGEAEGDQRRTLPIGRVTLLGPGDEPLGAHFDAAARRSLIASLREATADQDLDVVGDAVPQEGGLALRLQLLQTFEGEYFPTGEWSAGGDARWGLTAKLQDTGMGSARATQPWSPPTKSSLFPPLFAIALAILLRKPVIALAIGVLTGTFLAAGREGASLLGNAASAPVDFFHPYFTTQLVDPARYQIVGFVVAMLAMIGVLSRSGGIQGLMDHIARYATTVKRTQIVTWILGLMVFFDDYTNTILCGATMRPLTDRFRVSREKLSYLVDSTAAPVAGLMIVSTWIAFEVSTFSNQLPAAGLLTTDGYTVFIETLPYRFYCILTLFFVGLVVISGRDFGPMLTAERRARRTGQLLRPGGQPMVSEEGTAMQTFPGVQPAAWRALVPLMAFLGITIFQILNTGGAFAMAAGDLLSIQGLKDVLGEASSSLALFQGSAVGLVLAIGIALFAGLGEETFRAAWTTLRSMGVAVVILYLAWMVAAVCESLGTAPYLTALLGDSMHPAMLPAILFLLSGLVSFATGTSWGTMGILLPLVVGLSFTIGEGSDIGGHLLMVMSIGAVLEGSIFGDHCSPISDTTVLSSVACAADHIDHVRTQAPYALVTMAAGMVCGYLPAAYFGMSPYLGLLFGAAVITALVFAIGKRADDPHPG